MSDMFAALEWWRSFHRNPNFWDWVRDVNSDEELVRLTQEATDSRLGQQYDPFGEHFGLAALECLSKLSMASEVHNQTTFEEFLVRNALKIASEQLIKEGRKRKP